MAKSTYQMDAETLSIRSFSERENKDGSVSAAHVTISGTEEGGERSAVIRVSPATFDAAVKKHVAVAIDERLNAILGNMNENIDTAGQALRAALRSNVRDVKAALRGEGVSASAAVETTEDTTTVETRAQATSHGHNVPAEGNRLVGGDVPSEVPPVTNG